jgi:hypothetical protein
LQGEGGRVKQTLVEGYCNHRSVSPKCRVRAAIRVEPGKLKHRFIVPELDNEYGTRNPSLESAPICLELRPRIVSFAGVLLSLGKEVGIMKPLSLFTVAALACFSTFASADLKIKTRTTVMGHTTESTVYIKGPRERSEISFGRGSAVSITQCDQKRMITVSGNQCMVMPMGGAETSCPTVPNIGAMGREMTASGPTPPRKGGVVTITRTSNDTGERQDMFGYKARHIRTSMVRESSPDACNQSHTKMEMDG